MDLKEYLEQILEDPTEDALLEARKVVKQLRSQTAGAIGYELKILGKEIDSMITFSSPKAGIMQWPKDKVIEYLKRKKRNLGNSTLSLKVILE